MRCTGGPVRGSEVEFRIVCRDPKRVVVGEVRRGIFLRRVETRVFDRWGQLIQSQRRLFLFHDRAVDHLQQQVRATRSEFAGRRRRS